MKQAIALLFVIVSSAFGAPLQAVSNATQAKWPTSLTCPVCEAAFLEIRKLLESNAAEEDIIKIAIAYCLDVVKEDKNVCESIIPLFKDEFFGVIDKVYLEPSEACGVLIENGCGSPYDPRNQNWTIPLTNVPKPPVSPISPPSPTAPKNRILHLSDVHVDRVYTPGLSNDCGEPLCCRPPNAKGVGKTAAGYWGDYNCDVPVWTLEDLLQKLAKQSDTFDWVYWTGDIPAHNVWNQSRDDQKFINKLVSDLIRKYLPEKPVFPSIGNHESSPVNSFPPPYITGKDSNQWLLDALAEDWKYWLSKDAIITLLEGGYYIQEIRKGLKVISLQTNYCNTDNWWLYINATDPANQLRWLVNQLQEAETMGDKVHLIGHIPPGHGDCMKSWSRTFHKIVNRYESTIVGQFYGHSHSDEIQVYYDEVNTKRPTSVAMVGPSVTTYTGNNMGYRIYTIDGNHAETTNALLDFEVYYMNVSDSRITNQSNWLLEYTASKDYQMEHGFPSDFDDLLKRFEQNDDIFQSYHRHINRMHHPTHCDSSCKASTICSIKTTISGDHSMCDDLPEDLTWADIDAHTRQRQAC